MDCFSLNPCLSNPLQCAPVPTDSFEARHAGNAPSFKVRSFSWRIASSSKQPRLCFLRRFRSRSSLCFFLILFFFLLLFLLLLRHGAWRFLLCFDVHPAICSERSHYNELRSSYGAMYVPNEVSFDEPLHSVRLCSKLTHRSQTLYNVPGVYKVA